MAGKTLPLVGVVLTRVLQFNDYSEVFHGYDGWPKDTTAMHRPATNWQSQLGI